MKRRVEIEIHTPGRGTIDVTDAVQNEVKASGVDLGMCHLFLRHTSASLIICENADPSVRHDLETFMARIAPDGDPSYRHSAEGPDDMPAHIRSILTTSALTIPVDRSRLALGTWQGIYLWEHRSAPHRRKIMVSVWDAAPDR